MTLPAVFGLAGTELSAGERAFFRDSGPAGYCLFARNVADPGQLRALTDALRDLAGREVLIAIDQEGGRVARMKPPHWPEFPPAAAFGRLYRKAPMSAIEAARANAEAIGMLLGEAGINMNCAPVLDLVHEGANEIVGDRSFGAEPMQVAALGRAMLDGLAAAGVAGCIKHMPGHGRAAADSHWTLPVVGAGRDELEADFAPFRALAERAPAGMVAHILYTALDSERPASISPRVIAGTVRADIGFGGLLLSDDIAMKALSGTPAETARAVVEAGCDLALHCSGDLAAMEEVVTALGEMSDAARARLERALVRAAQPPETGFEALAAKRDALLALAA